MTVTDEQVEAPETPVVEVFSEKEACPICGGWFAPGPGLARHMSLIHPGERMESQDTPCPECGKFMTAGSMTRHRRKVHGVLGKRGRPIGSKNLPATRTPRTVRTPVDRNPEPLTADQITTAAAIALFPGGVPTNKLPLLLRWHDGTHTFLREVSNE
jgi:uncharacterized C2H2 Zn-finger protein